MFIKSYVLRLRFLSFVKVIEYLSPQEQNINVTYFWPILSNNHEYQLPLKYLLLLFFLFLKMP